MNEQVITELHDKMRQLEERVEALEKRETARGKY